LGLQAKAFSFSFSLKVLSRKQLASSIPQKEMATVGEQLRQAREKRNLSIADVADQTKIRKDHLEALEAGDYSVFAAPVYIRGFIRSYSNLLKLDTQQLLAELDRELGKTEKFADHPRLTGESKGILDYLMLQLSKINWRVALPLFTVALVLLISLFVYRAWKDQQTRDPLEKLGSGKYESKTSGETLPLPPLTRTNR
jgi:cytoskeletal protein RodZ